MKKRLFGIVLALVLCVSILLPNIANASTSLPTGIYLAQAQSDTCTLCSATMMLRARMYLSGNNGWSSITESGVRSTAWLEGTGLYWNFTYNTNGNSMTVSHKSTSGISIASLKTVLDDHPEGIVLYCGKSPHAVFLTDYEEDTFYCADPANSYSGKRIALSASLLGARYGSQSTILSNVTAYWYISSYSISATNYTVTFNANGGSCSTSTRTVTPGEAIGTLPTATRDGYEFAGWYDSTSSAVDPVTSSTTVNENITLYAHWINEVYSGNKINFDANGGSFTNYVQRIAITAFNTSRGEDEAIIYNCGTNLVDTNYWGREIAVNSAGYIVGMRGYNDVDQLSVPAGGFVLSMHDVGYDLYTAAEIGMYIGYATENGTTYAYLYDCQDDYLADFKYVENDGTYRFLPVPARDGYVFSGWRDTDGNEVNYYSAYSVSNLTAAWEALDSVEPEGTLLYNNHYYELYDNITSWTQAQEICESKGGHLVTFSDDQELAAVMDMFALGARGSYYIGTTDAEEEGNWVWVTGEKFSYTNWDPDYPEPSADEGENYAVIIAIENAPNKQVGEWCDVGDVNHNAGFYDWSNIGFICEYETYCSHEYDAVVTDATCVSPGYTAYTCTKCGDSYKVYDADYSEWSETKPEGVDESLIETKTEYRYSDKETITSYSEKLDGYTNVGGVWEQSGSGSIQYVKSWPSGFSTSHSLYSTYNKAAKSASETSTDKTVINSDSVTGYIYYHWCRGTYENGPINRGSKNTKQGEYTAFHAFYSTTNPNSLTAASDNDGSYQHSNKSCCTDSYWYFYVPVYTQSYTTYQMLFTHECWSDWSDWSETLYTESDTRQVEERTLYRAVTAEEGNHSWSEWIETKAATYKEDGKEKRVCSLCGEVETRAVAFVNPFVDVAEGKYYYEPVMWAVENGITSGTSATTFAPEASCTRAQVVVFLWRCAGCPEPTSTVNPFTDVTYATTSPFYKAILWAVEEGITSGTSATTFGPTATVNRVQFVTFLWRYMGKPTASNTTNHFTDVTYSTGSDFYKAIMWAVEAGVTAGKTATTFEPTSPCTRGQVVTFLHRALADG